MKLIPLLYIVLFTLVLVLTGCTSTPQNDLQTFENNLEKWRIRLKMPSFSASIIKDNKIIWAKGFGYANIEKKIPATENTVYHLASLTKPFASIILLQLVEQNVVNLNDPISKYGIDLSQAREYGLQLVSEDEIQVKHLLTHTAQGTPGSYYEYSGFLYGFLDEVITNSSNKNFAELLVKNITQPQQLSYTIPNITDSTSFSYTGMDSAAFSINCASPYVMDSLNNIVEGKMESYFGASAGLMSSALDMASFSIAVGKKKFLKPDTWEEVFSPTISTNGDTLPYSYGWFIQHYRGLKIIWHYGFWNTNSSLIIMVPEKGYNFVILANTNLLSRPFGLGGPDGNIFHSPFAIEFAQSFLFDVQLPEIDLELPTDQVKKNILRSNKSDFKDLSILKLFALASAYNTIGEKEYSEKAFHIYSELFTKPLPEKFVKEQLITEITGVKNNAQENSMFSLSEETEVLIFALGEGSGRDMYDYGWIENSLTGETIWKMTMEATTHAGGADKNRQINMSVLLPAGKYQLKYKSDDSHSFNQWNATPPEFAFYGIALYK